MKPEQIKKPKYELIKDELIARIKSNDFSHGQVFTTEKMLAEQYNVSNITAKRAITDLEQMGLLQRKRGVGSFVSASASARLIAAPDAPAQPGIISFLLPFDTTKGYFSEAIKTADFFLSANGYLMNLYITDGTLTKEKNTIKSLLSQNISGLVYYPAWDKINLSLLNNFIYADIPVIVIDKTTDCPYLHNIVSDNFEGGRLLTEHLIGLGHRNIAFFTTAHLEEISSIRNRFAGYLWQLKKSGIVPNPDFMVYYSDRFTENDAENKSLQDMIYKLYLSGVTGIIAENDHLALHIYHACRAIGLSVPEDLSLCGFDHMEMAQPIGLTSIKQNFTAFGEQIGQILLSSLQTPNAPIQKRTIPTELIIHTSTAAPR